MNQKHARGFISLILILFIFAIGIGIIFFINNKSETITKNSIPHITSQEKLITPTPFAFSEMTIPALRERRYESALGELQMYEEKANYTSYLTTYSSDGLTINGLLTIPKIDPTLKRKPFPAIVFVHGYIPPTLYKTTEKYIDYIDYLARNGFVVFKIDLRGHGKSEGEPGGGYYSSDYVIDTLNAYAALQSFDQIDKTKIGLWGHSMAGNVVSRSWAAKPEIPAVVIWAGAGYTYQDLIDYRLNDTSYRPPNESSTPRKKRDELFAKYGQFDPSSKFWKQVPMTNYLESLKGSIEVHHAVDDTVVSVEYSRNLMKVLDKTKVPHQLFEYPSGGHNISGSSFSKAMERTVEFYRNTLN